MKTVMDDMWNALELRPGACVAFIGAGGKTTSILALSEQVQSRGLTVVFTTTTKIWPPAGMPLILTADRHNLVDLARLHLRDAPCVALGDRLADSGKLVGLEPTEVCRLAGSGVADVVLCEADGAAGRSLKVHGPGEPVIPACITSAAVVAGLDALGQMPGPKVIHRFERFLDMPGSDAAETVNAATYVRILLRAAKHLEPHVPVAFILNKADDAHARHEAGRVSAELAPRLAHPTIVVTSHLAFMQRHAVRLQSIASEPDPHVTL